MTCPTGSIAPVAVSSNAW